MKNLFYVLMVCLLWGPITGFAQKSDQPEMIFSKTNSTQPIPKFSLKGKAVEFAPAQKRLSEGFAAYDLFQLDFSGVKAAAKSKEMFEMKISMGDKHQWNLLLMLNDMRAPDYQEIIMTEQGRQIVPKRRPITYKGYANTPGSLGEDVRLNISDYFVNGYVTIHGQEYFIEPLNLNDPTAPEDYFVIYRPEDVLSGGDHQCTFDAVQKSNSYQEGEVEFDLQQHGMAMMTCFEVDFVTAATWDFVQSQANDPMMANDRITAITNLVEGLYAPFMLDYVIVGQFAPASMAADPFTTSDIAEDILNSMQAWAGPNLPTHDLGQIWTGRDIRGCYVGADPTNFGLIGCAMCIGCVCGSQRYNVCENSWTSNTNCLRTLSAHECGHNWDGVHSESMPGSIMTPTINCNATTFTANNTARIQAHIDSRTCLALCCPLTVDCSNITNQTLACRADLPAVNFDLPIIVESCGAFTLSALTIIPGNSGCPGDPLVITRTYFIQDDAGNMEECMQTFTIVSNTAPTIQCPAGGFIACDTDIPPISADNATATVECGTPSVSVTGPVVNGTPNCIGTTYTYTYTVTDACNRMTSCTQVFTINSSSITIASCPAGGNVACAADIMVDPSDITVVTNCNVGFNTVITGPVVVGPADCPGTTYTYTYTATSVCGLTVSCDRTFTIQNNGPLLTCPADVTVECSDDIVVLESDVAVITSCGSSYTVLITGPNVLGGLPNCPGSRYRYYYTVTDACGRVAVCFREFVIDNDPPTIVCSPNQTVECASDIIINASEVTVTTSCDLKATITSSTAINGLPDCPGTTYTITYTVTDPCGRSASCDKIWTIQNAAPMIQECAPDRIVECSSDIMAEPELVVFTVSCELGYTLTPGPIVDLNGLGDCPGAQYSITYTLEDACGRSTNCTQTFTVDNRAPRVYPDEDQYVLCREDIAPRWEDCFVETDCNLGIVSYEIIGPIEEDTPDCNGKIINYLYSVTDACGRMTCVGQAWIIKNDGPSFDRAPSDVTVDCASVPDGSEVTASFSGCGNVRIDIADVIVPLAGLDYQIKRTFTATDDCGNSVSATQMITVICNGPSGNKEICSYPESGWADWNKVDQDGMTSKDWLSDFGLEDNALIIGLPGSSIAISDMYCIFQLLPSTGAANAFPDGMGDLALSNGVCVSERLLVNEAGRLDNPLAGQLIALKLNIRKDRSLEKVSLSDICESFSADLLRVLSLDPIVGEVVDYADATLSGRSEVRPEVVEAAVRTINEYFSACRIPGNCGGSLADPSHHEIRSSLGSSTLATARLDLSPNPASDLINIQFETVEKGASLLQVFNTNGTLMQTVRINADKQRNQEYLDISTWPDGIYLVALTNGKDTITKRFVKIKNL